jgi:uncharacterized SAM-binding protein YcdF (DUF218 family)
VTYVQPLVLVFLMIGFAGWARIRKSRGSGLVAIGLAGLFLISWPPVDWLLSRPLVARYSRGLAPMESAQSIVVLASSVSPPPYSIPDAETYERCTRAAWLHTHGHPLPVLACGGGAPGKPNSEAMREILQTSGVPASMIWTERQSRSTHENAVYGAAILREHGFGTIILVTEAQDMLRAERCFRKEGLTVVPYPIAFRHVGLTLEGWLPTWRVIARNERTLHETLGLAWYWLHGWI